MEEKEKKSTVKYSRIFYYFWKETKGYRGLVALSLVFVTLGSLTGSVIQPLIYQKMVDLISNSPLSAFEDLKKTLIWLILVAIAGSIFWRIAGRMIAYIESIVMKNLSDISFKKITTQGRRFFASNPTGGLISKDGRFTSSFGTILNISIYNFFAPVIVFIGILTVLFRQNQTLGFIFLTWILAFIGISFWFAKKKAPLDEESAAQSSKTTEVISDIISNILNVKIFSRIGFESKKYAKETSEEHKKRMRSWIMSANQNLFQSFAMITLEAVGLFVVIKMWQNGQITAGFFVLVQTYMIRIFDFIWSIGRAIRNFSQALSSAKEMVEIFETPTDIKDPENPEKCKIKNGEIVFENVSFEYKDGKDVFKDFNLSIPSGQKVGVVGHSGSGKTTITNLLLRFEDVSGGAVKIDGQDIRNITQDDLRRNISYVPQEPVLFHRTLKENIAYGNPDASDREIEVASKKAHAEEFIKDLKDGYETMVGERGVKLSGGQRQRIAIARVMLENSPILILDEATSSLDSISENLIQKAFDEAMKNRTTIVIAHRLSTIKKMDRIIVLDKGKVVEDGAHEDLLEKKGYYFKLWNAQKDGVI
jgi:ATP-binding cassette subfamily B protein